MINIVDGFQRKSIELMNKMNEIIKIRSTLDLRVTVWISSATPDLLLI